MKSKRALSIVVFVLTACATIALTACDNKQVSSAPSSSAEIALVEDNLDIYYVTEENTLAFSSVFARHTAEGIFAKWSDLNNVTGVDLIEYLFDSNGVETIHDDPVDSTTMISYEVGDYFTIEITLSSEFASYADGENGQLLVDSLRETFLAYHDPVHISEFNLSINEPHHGNLPDRGKPPVNELKTILFNPANGISDETAEELLAFADIAEGRQLTISIPIIEAEYRNMAVTTLSGFFNEVDIVVIDLDWSLPQEQEIIPITLRYISE